ncbi:MAG: STAS domain-containing protein [Armatimonadetes bacterium]|nr:STAS domain-containing protein [Armatimonadota bacterium]
MEGIRLEIELKNVDGLEILDAAGEIDVYTAPQFKEAINTILATGQKHLIVDMSRITYMDSSGFGALLSATRRLRPEGGTINMVNVSPAIDRILKITRLSSVFALHDSLDEAIQSAK